MPVSKYGQVVFSKKFVFVFSIWNSNFRPGIELIEQEQIESQKKDEENRARTILSKQASTDWSVEAVVDEDDLFK